MYFIRTDCVCRQFWLAVGLVLCLLSALLSVTYIMTNGTHNCNQALILIAMVSALVFALHLIPPRIISIPGKFMANLGINTKIQVAVFQSLVVLASSVFKAMGIACTSCLVLCLMLSISLLIFEHFANRAHFLTLALTFLKMSMAMAVSSLAAGEIGSREVMLVWGFAAFLFYVIETP